MTNISAWLQKAPRKMGACMRNSPWAFDADSKFPVSGDNGLGIKQRELNSEEPISSC